MSYKDIFNDIKNNSYSPVYVLFGRERYLFEMIMEKLSEVYENDSFKEFNFQIADSQEMTPDQIMDNFEVLPFMSDKRFVIVKNTPYFNPNKTMLTEDQEERLISYMENPASETIVIFQCGVSIDKRRRIYKAASKKGKVIELNKLEGSDLNNWIKRNIKSFGKDIDNSAIELLVGNIGYSGKNSTKTLHDIRNEILKLVGFVGEKTNIAVSDVNSILEKSLESNIFEMVDSMGDGKSYMALRTTDELLLEGESEFMILSMIARHFRLLKKTKAYLESGYTASTIGPKLGLHPFVAKKYSSQTSKFTHKLLTKIITEITEADYRIKSGKGTSRMELEKLIVRLCEISR